MRRRRKAHEIEDDEQIGWVDTLPITAPIATTLTAALASGSRVLTVEDAQEFQLDEGGTGILSLNGSSLAYATVDADSETETITLSANSPVAGEIDDDVSVVDPISGKVAIVTTVEVRLGSAGDQGDEDTVTTVVPTQLLDRLPQPGSQQAVVVRRGRDNTWRMTSVEAQAFATSDGIAPTSSPTPSLTPGAKQFVVGLTGIANTDPVKVDVFCSTSNPPSTSAPTFTVADGSVGSLTPVARVGGIPVSTGTTYYVRTRSRDVDGNGPLSSVQSVTVAPLSGGDAPGGGVAGSDGNPPGSSPAPIVRGAIRTLFVEIPATGNADDTEVDVWLSTTNPPSTAAIPAFTLSGNGKRVGATNVVGGSPVVVGTTYYAITKARDADGSAPVSSVGSGQLGKINTDDIVANSITAALIVADQALADEFFGRTFTGVVMTASEFNTDTAGQRIVVRDDGDGGIIESYSGFANEQPGSYNPTSIGGVNFPMLHIYPGRTTGGSTPYPYAPIISMYPGTVQDVAEAGSPLLYTGGVVIVQAENTRLKGKVDIEELRDASFGPGSFRDSLDNRITGITGQHVKRGTRGTGGTFSGPSDTKSLPITFNAPFSSAPNVTVAGRVTNPDSINLSVGAVTASGFTIYAQRPSGTAAFDIDWIATDL